MPLKTFSISIEDMGKKIVERILFNEKLRKELAAVKKEAKEKQKKISFKIPKLRDCKYHLGDGVKDGANSDDFSYRRGFSLCIDCDDERSAHSSRIFSSWKAAECAWNEARSAL